MSTDLTPLVLRASEHSDQWESASVKAVLQSVTGATPGSAIDWEAGDEEWARLLVNDEVCALICARLPLVLATSRVQQPESIPDFVVWCLVDEMSSSVFQVEKATLERVFDRELSDNVDYSALSADDLWWATV